MYTSYMYHGDVQHEATCCGRFRVTLPWADIPQDAWLDILFSHAQNEVLGCQVHSGRYWAPCVAFEKKRRFFCSGRMGEV